MAEAVAKHAAQAGAPRPACAARGGGGLGREIFFLPWLKGPPRFLPGIEADGGFAALGAKRGVKLAGDTLDAGARLRVAGMSEVEE